MTKNLSFLLKDNLESSVAGTDPPAAPECLGYSTMLANGWGWLTCFVLAIHLLELKALITVAITLGVAKVITGGGSAALFGGLFRKRLSPVGPSAHSLAKVLALHAEFLVATGQDVLAGGLGTLGPGATLRGPGHVSVLAQSLRGKSRENCVSRFSGKACAISGDGVDATGSSEGYLSAQGNRVSCASVRRSSPSTFLPIPQKQTWPQGHQWNPQS